MHTFMVPLDGSQHAERALRPAIRLARAAGGRLLLPRILPPPTPAHLRQPAALRPLVQAHKDELTGSADYLHRGAPRARAAGVEARWWVEHGKAADTLAAAAQREDADLVVVATRGRRGLDRWLVGSTAETLMNEAATPVLVVPSGWSSDWPDERPPRILVALDGTAFGEGVLGPAVAMARLLGAELCLLHAVTLRSEDVDDAHAPPSSTIRRARWYLHETAQRLRRMGLQVTTRVASGRPNRALAGAAVLAGADMVALASHGRQGLARMVFGNVAGDLLGKVGVPLLVTRPSIAPAPVGLLEQTARPAATGRRIAVAG